MALKKGPRFTLSEQSVFAPVIDAYGEHDLAYVHALEATASAFMAGTVADMNLINPDPESPYPITGITNSITMLDEAAKAHQPTATPAPIFPGFRFDTTFDSWVDAHARPENIAEIATILGSTTNGAYRHVRTALTLVHGLPHFHRRVLAGEFTSEHVQAAAQITRDSCFEHLPFIDAHLATRRADVTLSTFKKSLAGYAASLAVAEDSKQRVHARRGVMFTANTDGSATLSLNGPADDLYACYRRVEGFARAIHSSNASAFGDSILPGEHIDDDRSIGALMFDILAHTRPRLSVIVARDQAIGGSANRAGASGDPCASGDVCASDNTVGASLPIDGLMSACLDQAVADDHPIDPAVLSAVIGGMAGTTQATSSADSDGGSAGTGGGSAGSDGSSADVGGSGSDGSSADTRGDPARTGGDSASSGAYCGTGVDMGPSGADIGRATTGRRTIELDLPSSGDWLAQQASVLVTVPALTLTGDSQLPGTLPEGSPIPAEMARTIAAGCSTWTRILTDPATGTPLDSNATNYTIPKRVRTTLQAKWRSCTMPGCSRSTETTEIDHILPFDHKNPAEGGLTVFSNLHPLCKRHHQAKTDRRFHVAMRPDGSLSYRFRHGITTMVAAPAVPIDIIHAAQFSRLTRRRTAPDDTLRLRPRPGSVISRKRPGPPPSDDRPGWCEEYDPWTGQSFPHPRWHYGTDEPPPF